MSGKWTKYFSSGKIKEEGYYTNGNYKLTNYWDESGRQMVKEGNGHYILLFENGGKKAEGNFKSGMEDGGWNYYLPDGSLEYSVIYALGKKEGKGMT